ncbi:MAG: hypothetical protein AB7J40_04390, partial [Candidatus Altimarinota bacterium]
LKKHTVFRRARFDVVLPDQPPEKMVILLGQVHTVWKGKIGNRERKQIVRCQSRLCSYYAYFEQFLQVRSFGGEGIYEGLNTSFHDEQNFRLYRDIERKIQLQHPIPLEKLSEAAERMLHELGREWHRELLNQNNLKNIQLLAAAVSGQSLFNYLRDGQIDMYPIEGELAYRRVLEGITRLGHQIEKLEQTEEIRAVRSRDGKAKTEKEAEKILHLNALIQEFNRVIGSDIRERATFEILRQKSEQDSAVIFTMGIGHRKNYLSLVKEYFGESSTVFVFITAPELLINWWLTIGVPITILLILSLGNFWFLSGINHGKTSLSLVDRESARRIFFLIGWRALTFSFLRKIFCCTYGSVKKTRREPAKRNLFTGRGRP